MAGILFIISAPSGSGKSTLVAQVRTLVEGLEFSISYTTRAPRGSETDGREYHFTSRESFEQMIAADEFMEWAEVFGNYYGRRGGRWNTRGRRRRTCCWTSTCKARSR
jgi:guanylate kinase